MRRCGVASRRVTSCRRADKARERAKRGVHRGGLRYAPRYTHDAYLPVGPGRDAWFPLKGFSLKIPLLLLYYHYAAGGSGGTTPHQPRHYDARFCVRSVYRRSSPIVRAERSLGEHVEPRRTTIGKPDQRSGTRIRCANTSSFRAPYRRTVGRGERTEGIVPCHPHRSDVCVRCVRERPRLVAPVTERHHCQAPRREVRRPADVDASYTYIYIYIPSIRVHDTLARLYVVYTSLGNAGTR